MSAHNSDSEADKDMKLDAQNQILNKVQPNISARRNWQKALDDIKEARKSGVYSHLSDETEEHTARERVKSILQEPVKLRERPKSSGEKVSCLRNISIVIYLILCIKQIEVSKKHFVFICKNKIIISALTLSFAISTFHILVFK